MKYSLKIVETSKNKEGEITGTSWSTAYDQFKTLAQAKEVARIAGILKYEIYKSSDIYDPVYRGNNYLNELSIQEGEGYFHLQIGRTGYMTLKFRTLEKAREVVRAMEVKEYLIARMNNEYGKFDASNIVEITKGLGKNFWGVEEVIVK